MLDRVGIESSTDVYAALTTIDGLANWVDHQHPRRRVGEVVRRSAA